MYVKAEPYHLPSQLRPVWVKCLPLPFSRHVDKPEETDVVLLSSQHLFQRGRGLSLITGITFELEPFCNYFVIRFPSVKELAWNRSGLRIRHLKHFNAYVYGDLE